jgi:hypothetical protein
MNIIAAGQAPQPAPAQQMPAQTYQNTTAQQSAPPPKGYKIAVVPLLFSIINLAVIILVVVMIYRFVRATEKIAEGVQKGIVIRKDDTTT